MATRARSAQGVALSVHTSDAANKVITNISQANPAVVTSNAHGLLDGDIVSLAAVVGMVQINGLQAIVDVLSANTFALIGINSTGFTAYASGGTATPYVMTQLCEITAFNPTDPGAQLVDVSTICSQAREYLTGLPDDGTATITFNFVPSDDGLERLWALRDTGAADWFRVRIPATPTDPEVWFVAGKAVVQAASRWPTIAVNQAVQGNGSLKFTGGTFHLIA